MLISSTKIDKTALVALQSHLYKRSRTHDNDLVALSYLHDGTVQATDALVRDTVYLEYIRYTFFWTFKYDALPEFQDPRIQIIVNPIRDDDGNQLWSALLDATLGTWITYVGEDHPKKFVTMIKDQLIKDGYKPRLRRHSGH